MKSPEKEEVKESFRRTFTMSRNYRSAVRTAELEENSQFTRESTYENAKVGRKNRKSFMIVPRKTRQKQELDKGVTEGVREIKFIKRSAPSSPTLMRSDPIIIAKKPLTSHHSFTFVNTQPKVILMDRKMSHILLARDTSNQKQKRRHSMTQLYATCTVKEVSKVC